MTAEAGSGLKVEMMRACKVAAAATLVLLLAAAVTFTVMETVYASRHPELVHLMRDYHGHT